MHVCDICNTSATYHVANPGSNVQTFCQEHFPKFLKTTLPFVTILTQVPAVRVSEEPVIEEAVIENPVVEDAETLQERFPDTNYAVEKPAPKTRKKAAAAVPVEEPATE